MELKGSAKSGNPLTNKWKLEKNEFFTILFTNCVSFAIPTMNSHPDDIYKMERRLGSG